MGNNSYFYSVVALISSFSWALGAILWRGLGQKLTSYGMNLAKTVIGSFYLAVLLSFIGFEAMSVGAWVFLALSGIIGIAVGDTYFFKALMNLGPRRAALLGALNPVAISICAVIFLGEQMTPGLALGIGATSAGVGWVLWERSSDLSMSSGNTAEGFRYGFVSILCTVVAVLLAKFALLSAPTVQAAGVRLAAGALALLLWGLVRINFRREVKPFKSLQLLIRTAAVVAVVTFGGFWLSLLALKNMDAAVAGTLSSIGPIFILPLSVFLLKERLSAKIILGTVVAVGGVAIVLFSAK